MGFLNGIISNFSIQTMLYRALLLVTLIPVHEYAHAWVAMKLGDRTASGYGRLQFNPLAHLDPIGSVLMILTGFGWAKPVPVNAFYFKNRKRDMALTALAGPAANILFALVMVIFYKLLYFIPVHSQAVYSVLNFMLGIFYGLAVSSVALAFFNLLPIPPLDGSKIFNAVLPERIYFQIMQYERYIGIILIIVVVSGLLDGPLMFLTGAVMKFLDMITFFLG